MMLNKIKIIMILLGVNGMMSGCQPNSQHNKQKDQLESTENHFEEKLCLEPKDLLEKMYQSKLSIFRASEFELKQYFDQQLVQYFLTQQ